VTVKCRLRAGRHRDGEVLGHRSAVVDEPHRSDAGGDQQPHAGEVAHVRRIGEGAGVDHGRVVEVHERLGLDDGAHGRAHGNRRPLPPGQRGTSGGEGAGEDRGGGALGRRQADVAARERQPVGLAHDGAAHHLHRERQVLGQLAHDGQLLEVLETEVGAAAARDGEQFCHDGGDAVEMTRTRGALPGLAHAAYRHGGGRGVRPTWVHLAHARDEHHVGARLGAR